MTDDSNLQHSSAWPQQRDDVPREPTDLKRGACSTWQKNALSLGVGASCPHDLFFFKRLIENF